MTLSEEYLPRATPLDPAEDPPGSTDPLGTLAPAERIAEVLFPGMTARMWRPRFLTYAAVAALVSDRVVRSAGKDTGDPLAARLAFERLWVSALVRQQVAEPQKWRHATFRLPGSMLARRALSRGDQPLTTSSFLKGQATNGPFGVIARLAEHVGVVDEDGRLGRAGEHLLLAWAEDQEIRGLLDEDNRGLPGWQWLERYVQATADYMTVGRWMNPGWPGWRDLAERLRPDKMGKQERRKLPDLLESHPTRARCLKILRQPRVVSVYRAARGCVRGERERRVLLQGVRRSLTPAEQEEDRLIEWTVHLAETYEQVAGLLEAAFNGIRWGLTRLGGQAKPDEITAQAPLQRLFQKICRQLPSRARELRQQLERLPEFPQAGEHTLAEPLDRLASQAFEAAENPSRLIETVIVRHREVQSAKGKGMWIDTGNRWTLMPGFGLATEEAPAPEAAYLHTFRVHNAYSFLSDLGLVRVGVHDEEA